jgi:hypothetical protein
LQEEARKDSYLRLCSDNQQWIRESLADIDKKLLAAAEKSSLSSRLDRCCKHTTESAGAGTLVHWLSDAMDRGQHVWARILRHLKTHKYSYPLLAILLVFVAIRRIPALRVKLIALLKTLM